MTSFNPVVRVIVTSIALILTLGSAASAASDPLVVYTARKEHLIKPLFDEYTRQSGIKIEYITGKAPVLMQRIKSEGPRTPADLLITVDAGNLWHAAKEGVLQPVQSDILTANIPGHLRDPDHQWFGLSIRARTMVYSTKRVKPNELTTYEALAGDLWKNRLLLRTSKKVYNQSLVAMLIAEHGEEKAEALVKGWVDNLAALPFSNDTKVMEAILAGQGDVGIVNSYYFGRLQKKNPGLALKLFWPNQSGNGVHVNISGAGVVTHSKRKAQALAFLEWLSSPKAQQLFADANMEYPVNPKVQPHLAVAAWGPFKQNPINLRKAGELQVAAIRLMDRAGYR